jgi:hypothetical protein
MWCVGVYASAESAPGGEEWPPPGAREVARVTYRLLPVAAAISEFQGFNGDCGQAATLAALHVLKGDALTGGELDSIVRAQIGAHLASANGSEPASAIVDYLNGLGGLDVFSVPYAEPFTFDWHTYLLNNAGTFPIILEVATSGAGFGSLGDESGVHYHFICVLGIQDTGYMVADGDNVAAKSGQLVTYSYAQIRDATPCALIGVKVKLVAPTTHVPAGWHDDGTTLTAPNGQTMGHAFRDAVVLDAQWAPTRVPTSGEYSDGAGGTYQNLTDARLHWDAKDGVTIVALPPAPPTPEPPTPVPAQAPDQAVGTDLASVQQQLAALQAAIAQLVAAQAKDAQTGG